MTFDVTTNRIQFGMLTSEEKEALVSWPHGWTYSYSDKNFRETPLPNWFEDTIYRGNPAPREPKTIWVNEYQYGYGYVYTSEMEAKQNAGDRATSVAVKYQEVIE